MAVDTKPNLSDSKFEQLSGETLHLSGCTHIWGKFQIETGATLSVLYNPGIGKVLTSDSGGIATWQNLSLASGENITKEITQSSHGFVVGDVIGWSGGTYNKPVADGTYDGEVIGIVSCCVDVNTFCLTQAGYVSGLTGLVTNCTYFLSDTTAGLLTVTEPTTDGHISDAILLATSSSSAWVLPYPGYVISTGSTSGVVNACNGLTSDGVSVCLGGLLCTDTVINGNSNLYDLTLSSLSSFNVSFTDESTITDLGTTGGLRYAANYCANYGDRSLVDKQYVDLAISNATSGITGTLTGATNGLSVSGMDIALGGTLTGNTCIQIPIDSTTSLYIGNNNKYTEISDNYFSISYWDSGTTMIGSLNIATNDASLGWGNDYISESVFASSAGVGMRVDDFTNITTFLVVYDKMCANSNNPLFSGIEYAGDYSANYTPRSLVDKAYVTGLTSTITTNYVTGATNLGTGNGTIYTSVSDHEIQLKTLSGGTNITLTTNGNYIGINSTGALAWTGNTVNGVGTYVDSTHICSEPNMTFDGSLLTVTGAICGTSCVRSPLITGTTVCASTCSYAGEFFVVDGELAIGNCAVRSVSDWGIFGSGDNAIAAVDNANSVYHYGAESLLICTGSILLNKALTSGVTICGGTCVKSPSGCFTNLTGSTICATTCFCGTVNCAVDSDKLDNQHGSYYAVKANTITGATNLGTGNGTIYTSVSNNLLQLKTLSGGSNVTITTNGNYIGISANDTSGIEWVGSTANGVATYINADTICSQPNMTFDGTQLKVTGNICATSCVRSPLLTGGTICGSTCVSSPIMCASSCVRSALISGTTTCGGIVCGGTCVTSPIVCSTSCSVSPVFIESGTCLASKYLPFQMATDMNDPTGFVDGSNIAISYNYTNRTITLTGTLTYYWKGVKKTLTSPWTSSAHAATAGQWFLYSTDGTNFTWSQSAWLFKYIQVAYVYYQPTEAATFAVRETHELMDFHAHEDLHSNIGTWLKSGGQPTAGSYTVNTGTDTAVSPSFDAAIVDDEDLASTIASWNKASGYTLMYASGTTSVYTLGATRPFLAPGANQYMYYYPPATGVATIGANNRWHNVYQILIPVTSDAPSQKYRMIFLQPQVSHTSLAAAQAEDTRGLSLGTLTSSAAEFVIYSRISYSLITGYVNYGKAGIPTGGITYVIGGKFATSSVAGVSATNHASLSNLTWTNSGHLGNNNCLAGFDGSGNATYYPNTMSSAITGATNGLTKSGQNVVLGGALTKYTGIDLGSTYCLVLSSSTSNYFAQFDAANDTFNVTADGGGKININGITASLSSIFTNISVNGSTDCIGLITSTGSCVEVDGTNSCINLCSPTGVIRLDTIGGTIALTGTLNIVSEPNSGDTSITYVLLRDGITGEILQYPASGMTGGGGSTASGERITKLVNQTSHGFNVMDVIGWSGGTYNKSIANGTYDGEIIGLVTKCYNANCFDLTQAGYATGLTGLVTNTTYFLSDTTSGLLTSTKPTITGHIVKSVIAADSTTSGWVLPYPAYLLSVDSGDTSSLSEYTISGNSSSVGFVVNHGKNKQYVMVQVVEAASPYSTVYTDVQRPNANCVCVCFDTAPLTGTNYKILIIN